MPLLIFTPTSRNRYRIGNKPCRSARYGNKHPSFRRTDRGSRLFLSYLPPGQFPQTIETATDIETANPVITYGDQV